MLSMVMGNMTVDSGDKPPARKGVVNAVGKKGKAKPMHINAFESAPPKPPV